MGKKYIIYAPNISLGVKNLLLRSNYKLAQNKAELSAIIKGEK